MSRLQPKSFHSFMGLCVYNLKCRLSYSGLVLHSGSVILFYSSLSHAQSFLEVSGKIEADHSLAP